LLRWQREDEMIGLALGLLAAASQIGSFGIAIDKDPVTDKARVHAMLAATNGTLSIGCDLGEDSKIRIVLDPDERLETGNDLTGDKLFTVRFDELKAATVMWHVRDSNFAYTRDRVYVRPFLEQLLAARRLIIRADRSDGQNIDMSFEVREAAAALRVVADRCGDPKLRGIVDEEDRRAN
jgi:hypothetical protein